MPGLNSKRGSRERQLREQRTRTLFAWNKVLRRFVSWSSATAILLIVGSVTIALAIDEGLDYAVGQRVSQPVYAKVAFQVADPKRTEADREAAQAKVPSHYTTNDPALTSAKQVEELVNSVEGVLFCHGVRSRGERWHHFLDLNIHLPGKLSLEKAHEITHKVETKLKRTFPGLVDVIIHTEATLYQAIFHLDRCQPIDVGIRCVTQVGAGYLSPKR